MIDVNEIAKKDALKMKDVSDLAKRFITELNGEQAQLQVEEILLSDDGKSWIVSVSYFRQYNSPNELQRTLGLLGTHVYKRLNIVREPLQVVGMTDWSPNQLKAA